MASPAAPLSQPGPLLVRTCREVDLAFTQLCALTPPSLLSDICSKVISMTLFKVVTSYPPLSLSSPVSIFLRSTYHHLTYYILSVQLTLEQDKGDGH